VPKSQISEIADTTGWKGGGGTKYAEPAQVRTLPVVDNSHPYASNVRTSVDCYVSGSYITKNGRAFEVTQRYTIFISYNKETQAQTMNQVRQRIVGDFQAKYGRTFNVTNVYIPQLPIPKVDVLPGLKPGGDIPMEMYFGSGFFRNMSRYERLRSEVGTEKIKAKTNIQSVRKRYGYKR
jgi:hypothetical protein